MKKVKWIYFPVILLLISVFTILSFVHVASAGDKKGVNAAYVDSVALRTNALVADRNRNTSLSGQDTALEVRNSVVSFLRGLQTTAWTALTAYDKPVYDDDGKDTGEKYDLRYYRNEAQQKTPWYIVQNETINFDTLSKMDSTFDEDHVYASAGKEINNVVVMIPGAKTRAGERGSDAILVSTHLDPAKKTPGSEDAANTVMIAAMMEEIGRLVKNDGYYENDIVFLFTDSRYDSSLGVYSFMNQFVGMRKNSIDMDDSYDLAGRIKFAINFDSMGTGASSMLIAAGQENANLVAEYADSMGASFSSSFVTDLFKSYRSDYDAYKGLNSLNLVTFGDLQNNNNAADTVDNLGSSHIKTLAAQKGSMLVNVLNHFGKMDLSKLDGGAKTVYFSVLGLFTVSYPVFVSYIFGAILILLFIAAIVLNLRKKAFSIGAMVRGVVMQLLSIAAAMVAVFALYFLIAIILSGFGVLVLQSILTIVYCNVGLIIGFTLLLTAMLGLFYNIFKNLFAVKATDTVRGGASLFIIVAAVLSFAYPALGYLIAIPAILAAGVMITSVLSKNCYKNKCGQDIERLMLYLVPIAFALPLMLPVIWIMAAIYPMVLMPVILLPVVMLLSMVAPYLTALKPAMSKLLAKLPKRTIRIKRLVTEQQEDPAKKGKFNQVTHNVITTEKVTWKYHHGVLMTIIAVVASVIIMVSASVKLPIGAAVYGLESDNRSHFTQTLFDDSFIVSWAHSGTGVTKEVTTLQIRDKEMYKSLRYVLSGYKWDAETQAYVKNFNWQNLNIPLISSPSTGGNRISIKPADNGAAVGICEITLLDASKVEFITVFNDTDVQIMKIENIGLKEKITVRLPLNADNEFTLEVSYLAGNNQSSTRVLFKQYVWYPAGQLSFLLDKSKDFGLVKDYFDGQNNAVRFGMYFENETTVNYSL